MHGRTFCSLRYLKLKSKQKKVEEVPLRTGTLHAQRNTGKQERLHCRCMAAPGRSLKSRVISFKDFFLFERYKAFPSAHTRLWEQHADEGGASRAIYPSFNKP
jgi:hypothetical protein